MVVSCRKTSMSENNQHTTDNYQLIYANKRHCQESKADRNPDS